MRRLKNWMSRRITTNLKAPLELISWQRIMLESTKRRDRMDSYFLLVFWCPNSEPNTNSPNKTSLKYEAPTQIEDSEDAKENWEEMTYLGSGAFSNVYKVGNGKFLKISRAASLEKSLGEELKILKVLEQRTMGSHDIRGYYYVCTYSLSACIHLHNLSKISYSLLLHVHYTYSSRFFLVIERINPFFIR